MSKRMLRRIDVITAYARWLALAAVAAGYGLQRRRRWGRSLTMGLAWGSIPFGLLSCSNVSAVAAFPYSIIVLLLVMIFNRQFGAEFPVKTAQAGTIADPTIDGRAS